MRIGTNQATGHYLNQWWHSLLTYICVTRPQWVKLVSSVTPTKHLTTYTMFEQDFNKWVIWWGFVMLSLSISGLNAMHKETYICACNKNMHDGEVQWKLFLHYSSSASMSKGGFRGGRTACAPSLKLFQIWFFLLQYCIGGLKIYNIVIKIVFEIYCFWNIYHYLLFNQGEAIAPPLTWNPGSTLDEVIKLIRHLRDSSLFDCPESGLV